MFQFAVLVFSRIDDDLLVPGHVLLESSSLDVLKLHHDRACVCPFAELIELDIANDGAEGRLVDVLGKLVVIETTGCLDGLFQHLHRSVGEWRLVGVGGGKGCQSKRPIGPKHSFRTYVGIAAWKTARPETVRDALIASHRDALLPVTHDIILRAKRFSATDAFCAYYRLRELKQVVDSTFKTIDALAVPTAATIPTVAELESELQLTSRSLQLFCELLDLAACAVPKASRKIKTPAA